MKLRVFLICSLLLSGAANRCLGAEVTWDIDQSQSWIRLTIPDQLVDIGGGTTVQMALRGAQPIYDVNLPANQNPPIVPWADNLGRRAPIDGNLATDYTEGSSIQFLNLNHTAFIVETGQWIPNRNFWNAVTEQFDYHTPQADGHASAFAAELTIGGTLRVGHITLYNSIILADGTVTLTGGPSPWTSNGGSMNAGQKDNGNLDFWTQILVDDSHGDVGECAGLNNGGITIEDMGGGQRKMTIPLDIDFVTEINDLPLNADFAGQIVAFATLPSAEVTNVAVYHNGYAGVDKIDTRTVAAKEGSGAGTLSYTNVINSSHGLNGMAFDVQGLAGSPTAADFDVQMSPQGVFDPGTNPPSGWAAVPTAPTVTVTPGSPARVLLTWPNNTIARRWARVTIKANANTGLAAPSTYYVGHLLGETTGLSGASYAVAFADLSQIRTNAGQVATASNVYDVDKSGQVQFSDVSVARGGTGNQLTNITIP